MNKTSLLLKSQLPAFIRDDANYQTFVIFLEAYYSWMEQHKGVLFESGNLLDYADIDTTLDEYIEYFYNEFLPSYPPEILADKRKLIRFSKSAHESKGNQESFRFLFRVLYNEDIEIIENKEFVLKASAGKWFQPRSLKLKTKDPSWINCGGLWVIGKDSKGLAKIERAKYTNTNVDLFISDIERLFNSGEYIRVVDKNLKDVYFNDGDIVTSGGHILEAKIVGAISTIDINPKFRGNYYEVGDPVVLYGGLEDPINDIGASAEVQEVTLGSIQRVKVKDGSWGYRENPNTFIYVTPDSGKPILTVGGVDPAKQINVSVVIDSLELKKHIPLHCNTQTGFVQIYNGPTYDYWKLPMSDQITMQDMVSLNVDLVDASAIQNYHFKLLDNQSIIANANTSMSDAFSYTTFPTYSIETVDVQNGGGGFKSLPTLAAESMYETDLPFSTAEEYDPRYYSGHEYNVTSIKDFGILGPILFKTDANGLFLRGNYYQVGDEITFSGGIGGGAYAKVISIENEEIYGPIDKIEYYISTEHPEAPLGGFGYRTSELPILYVTPKQKIGNVVNNSSTLTITSVDGLANVCIGKAVSGNGIPSNTFITAVDDANLKLILSNSATANTTDEIYYISGVGAEIYVSTVLGDSAKLIPLTDRIGSITKIKITNYGEDYVENPTVSLRVQDIAVVNVELEHLPEKGDYLYQGYSFTESSYKSQVDSVRRIDFDVDSTLSTFIIRTYNYTKLLDANTEVTLYKPSIETGQNTFPLVIDSDYTFPSGETSILTFGDGTAKANSRYLNGLILGPGRYLDDSHQPSSFSLLQSENYNNFTYLISVQKEISRYRNILYDVLHPAGTKVLGQNTLKSENSLELIPKESTFAKKGEFFDFIWAALSTEEDEQNSYTSELIRFPDSKSIYGYAVANNSNELKISNFPPNIFVGQKIIGKGLVENTIIKEIYLSNNTILLSTNATTSSYNEDYLVQEVWTGNTTNYIADSEVIQGSTTENSNLFVVYSVFDNISSLEKPQVVSVKPVTIYANTTNNSNLLENVESVENVVIGQYVSGNNIPYGTRVADVYTINNTIVLTETVHANTGGIHYTYYDTSTGSYVNEYKYNYVSFSGIPYNTYIVELVPANNSIIISENYVKSQKEDIFYIVGSGGYVIDRNSDLNSEFIRVESESLVEMSGLDALAKPKDKYYTYNDYIYVYDNSGVLQNLVTEANEPVIASIYIKLK